MDLRRVKPIDWATGLFGAALVAFLWLPWYRAGGSPVDAWQAMSVDHVIFLIAGLLGVWVIVLTASHSTGAVPVSSVTFATWGGLVVSILALVRLIDPPDLGPGPTGRQAGVWLGTAAALGLLVSAARNMHDERRGAPVSSEVAVTELPAPRVREEGGGA